MRHNTEPNYDRRATVVGLLLLILPMALFLLLPSKAPGKPRWQDNMSCFSFANASAPSFPVRCLKLNHPNHFAAEEDLEALAALLAEQEAVTALVRIPGGEGGADRYWIRWTGEEGAAEDLALFPDGSYLYQDQQLTRYILSGLETGLDEEDALRVRILFPTFLLDDSQPSYYMALAAGEDTPLLSGPPEVLKGPALPSDPLELMEVFYSGSRWYQVRREEGGLLLSLTHAALEEIRSGDLQASRREELETGPLLLTVETSPDGVPLVKIVPA